MKKRLSILLTIVLSLAPLSACSSQNVAAPTEAETIKIGVFQPLTGENAGGGELEAEGSKLAHSLYGEVLGKKVELFVVDNKSDKAEAASAAARLIEKDKVVAIIGSYGSSLSMAAGNIVQDNKIPAVGASCTNPQVTLNNDYYFRVCFIDPYQGKVMANYAFDKLGAKKAAIIQEVSNDYSVGLASFFVQAFTELTGDANCIVDTGNYQTNDKDFSAILTNVKAKNPDVIFAPGNFTESALVIKQARQLGITCPIIGGDTWETSEFLEVGGAEVEGIAFSTAFAAEKAITEEGKVFLEAFAKAYPGQEPSSFAALGYDAYILILDAITRANSTDPQKIRDALAETQGFEGAAGIINLDENGDAVKSAFIKTVKDGKFTYLDSVDAN